MESIQDDITKTSADDFLDGINFAIEETKKLNINNKIMSEKVKVASVTSKEWKGKMFYNVTLDDGRTGSSTDAKILEYNEKEVELEIKDSGREFQGAKQYYFDFPKNGTAGGGKFPAKDWTFEKRKAALECAVQSESGGMVETKKIIERANEFLVWLNQK